MITRIAYKPYASGENSTQTQHKKINFGISEKDAKVVNAFAEKLAHATRARTIMARISRLTSALNAFKGMSPGTTVASIIEELQPACLDALAKQASHPKLPRVLRGRKKA